MFKKFSAILFCCFLLFVIAGNIQAKAKASWAGINANVYVKAEAIGNKSCEATNNFPGGTLNLPMTETCEVARTAIAPGSAFAEATCDAGLGWKSLKVHARVSGFKMTADKSQDDSAVGDGYARYYIDGGEIKIEYNVFVYSQDSMQSASIKLNYFYGDSVFNDNRVLWNLRNEDLIRTGIFADGTVQDSANGHKISGLFTLPGIAPGDTAQLNMILETDTHSYIKTPTSSFYGKIALIVLLSLTAGFFVFRKYRVAA